MVDDRIVAVFGRSIMAREKRDAVRMAGFPRGVSLHHVRATADDGELVEIDCGPYFTPIFGGRTDVNILPQRREVNRGWSARGKVYRRMERYWAEHSETPCFSHPIYRNRTWAPHEMGDSVMRGAWDL